MWESARLKNTGGSGSGYPSFSTQNKNFFSRHMRKISNNLPRFSANNDYAEKEKLGRGQWSAHNVPLLGRLRGIMARMGRKMKIRLLLLFLLLLSVIVFYNSREWPVSIVPGKSVNRGANMTKHWYITGEELHGLAAAKSLLSYWPQM